MSQLTEIERRYKQGETTWHLDDIALLLSLLPSRASVAAVEGDVLVSLVDVLKVVDVCTCGSGPEWRSVGMRHHALTCQTHLATLIRTLPAAASSPASPCCFCGAGKDDPVHADTPVVAAAKDAAQEIAAIYGLGHQRGAIAAIITRHFAATPSPPSETAVGGEAQRVLDEIVMILESVADNDEAVRMLFNTINHHKSAAPLPAAGADEGKKDVEVACIIPVGRQYSVSIGTKRSGIGIRVFERLGDARDFCDAVNTYVAAALRAKKEKQNEL